MIVLILDFISDLIYIYIYMKWSMTSFKTEQHVKTVEQVYALNKEHELCQLFSPEAIKRHRREGHNFIHIGLVQVAIKPLTRRGLKASVMLGLRDAASRTGRIVSSESLKQLCMTGQFILTVSLISP